MAYKLIVFGRTGGANIEVNGISDRMFEIWVESSQHMAESKSKPLKIIYPF